MGERQKKIQGCCGELSLGGMQSPLSFLCGNVYAVSEEDDRLADLLLWSTAAAVVSAGHSVCVISASSAAKSIDQSGCADIVHDMIRGQDLSVLLRENRYTR